MHEFSFDSQYDLCANIGIDWNKIENKTIMITGATGLVGRYLIEVLLRRNRLYNAHIKIIAVTRNKETFSDRFNGVIGIENAEVYEHDVQEPCHYDRRIDYIVHMASNTHPRLYASDPIGTEMINILGSYHLLELAAKNPDCRFVFTSSGDIYGDNRTDKEYLSEEDCGYINCNTLRAGYIEGKRASEALCNAFHEKKGVDYVISRLCRIYGPTMNLSDSKAISQFIINAVNRENIVLKSRGLQTFSYLYVFDVITALLTVITNGKTGEAYNIADNEQVISLSGLAGILAEIAESKVIFDLPDALESKGASSFQNVKLDGTKLGLLGWKAQVGMKDGLRWTVEELRKTKNNAL